MPDIELSIPVGLTTSQIIRVNPSIDEETTKELTDELHDIVACMQKAFALQPPGLPIEESDIVQTILRTAVGFWPGDKDAAECESAWVTELISRAEQLTGVKDLYHRYLLISDKVCDTDNASAELELADAVKAAFAATGTA
jgi:hypothetical protein